jgi:hypothetical protein
MQPVAVELDFMEPTVARRGVIDACGQLRSDELRDGLFF